MLVARSGRALGASSREPPPRRQRRRRPHLLTCGTLPAWQRQRSPWRSMQEDVRSTPPRGQTRRGCKRAARARRHRTRTRTAASGRRSCSWSGTASVSTTSIPHGCRRTARASRGTLLSATRARSRRRPCRWQSTLGARSSECSWAPSTPLRCSAPGRRRSPPPRGSASTSDRSPTSWNGWPRSSTQLGPVRTRPVIGAAARPASCSSMRTSCAGRRRGRSA
mmetsp:Transcript_115836/g.360794  ORF Transcript_115836/g.360794 Transcript_115836/m.360794 type:complete len:222 (+) Transcript_115836:159-824(+)